MRIPVSLALAVATGAASLALTPLARRLALRAGAVDAPGPRRVHREPVPTMGGLAILVATLAVAWMARLVSIPVRELDPRPLLGWTLACIPIVALGVVDDVRGTTPWVKLVIQACAAMVLVHFGFGVPVITNPFGEPLQAGWLNGPLAVLWVLVVVNAINLIDGLDGLASGAVLIASATLWWVARQHADFYVMFIASLLIGATAGFLRWNFPPARIFMGDTGSQFLGLTLAAVSLLENRKGTAAVTLLFPLVALGVPIADSVLAFVRRAARGAPVFRADSEHIHHRLLRLGLPPRTALLVLWAVCAVFGLAAAALSRLPRGRALGLAALLAVVLFLAFEALERFERRAGPITSGPSDPDS